MRLIIILLIIPLLAKTQDINFSLSNGIGQHKEGLIQPIPYTGFKTGIGIDYTHRLKNNHLLFADIHLSGIITAKTALGNDMSQLNLNLELGYLFDTKIDDWMTGISIQSQYDYALYSLNYEYPFWYTQYSLNWNNRYQLSLNKNNKLTFSLSVPIVGLFSRTESEVLYTHKEDYTKAYFHRNMTFGSLNHSQVMSSSILFSKEREKRTSFRIGYRVDYFNYLKPKPVSSIYHSIILSVNLKLKK